MKFNIAVAAAVLTGIVTLLTGALAPSARDLRELRATDKATWNRLNGSICSGCGSEKASVRSVLTDPIAVLAAAPRPPSDAIGYNTPQPKVRTAGSYVRYASLHRRRTQRYAARMRKERHHYASLKFKRRIQVAEFSKRAIESVREEEAIRSDWNTIEMYSY